MTERMNVESLSDFDAGNELEEFARALEQSHDHPGSDYVLELYQSIAAEKARSAFEKDEAEFENSELEARLWSLIKDMYGYRLSGKEPSIDAHGFNGDAVFQEKYLRENPKSKELWIIIHWLHGSMLEPKEPSDLRGTKWVYTKSEIKKLRLQKFSTGSGGGLKHTNAPRRSSVLAPRPEHELVTQLDADAPLRQNRGLAKDDEDFDRQLYKYIFHLLLKNDVDEALKVCERTGNWTLKMAIQGMNSYIDHDIDNPVLGIDEDQHKGIEQQPLWRRMCFEMAKQTNIDPYERGIYGILSNDLSSVLELCDTWESQLLAYLSHMLAEDSEKPLLQAGRIDPQVRKFDVPHTRLSTAQNALDVLAHSTNPVVRQQSESLLRNLAGAVINDTVSIIVDQLAHQLDLIMAGSPEAAASAEDLPYIIRITTHLILFLQNHGKQVGSTESIAKIVRAYIQILCHESKSHLVPLYVSYLPDDLANETYSFLLANITDVEERKQHLDLGKKYKLKMDNMVRLAVERVFQESPQLYQTRPVGYLVTEVDEADVRLYKAVEWYVNSGLYGDALHSSVFLFRRFLSCGRVQSAKEFGMRVSLSALLKKYDALVAGAAANVARISDDNRAEIIEYDRFIQCLIEISHWNDHYGQLLEKNPNPTMKDVSRTWQSQALEMINSVSLKVHELCDNWMVQLLEQYEDNSEDWAIIEQIRATYIPHLLLELAKVLVEAQVVHTKFLKQAVELANLVANEDSKLYEYFIKGKVLNPFLHKITEAFIDGVAEGEKGIYD